MFKLLFVVLLVCLFSCHKIAMDHLSIVHNKEMIIDTAQGPIAFGVEIANTAKQRAEGLSFRRTLAKNRGMLFIFERSDRHAFWMKNTFIPLDLIFLDDTLKVVGTIENATPMSLTLLDIKKESLYVLEVPAGTVKQFAIKENLTGRLIKE